MAYGTRLTSSETQWPCQTLVASLRLSLLVSLCRRSFSAHVVCEFIVNLRLTNKTQRSFKLQFLDLAPCDVADNEAIPEASKASASATLESLVACLKVQRAVSVGEWVEDGSL